MMSNWKLWIPAVFLLFFSCKDELRVFEENKDTENGAWYRDQPQLFNFEITDTARVYNVLANIRSASSYPYYNLFVKAELIDKNGVIVYNDVKEGYLFNPVSGKPYGQTNAVFGISLGDMYDQRIMLCSQYKFLLPGEYRLRLSHFMRDTNPVKEVLSVGCRIEYAF